MYYLNMIENRKTNSRVKKEKGGKKKKFDNLYTFTQVFDNLNLGIIVFDITKGTVLYSNNLISGYSTDKKKFLNIVLKAIRQIDNSTENNNISRELSIRSGGRAIKLGYSRYMINPQISLVLLSDIASKTVYSNTKQENIFYDKLSELIAEVAHEIGNPLAGISMSLQVLLNNITEWPGEKSINYITRTILEIDRLSGFLKSIREVSKETELHFKKIKLKRLVDKLIAGNMDLIKDKGIKIENTIEENLEALLDENAFYQILLNLLNNSLHILKKNQKISIFIENIDHHYIKMIYMNNGEPISNRIIDKVFSPFFTTREKGQGIGLAISLKLMTRMGGTIRVETPVSGTGVKFSLYIQNRTEHNGTGTKT